MRFNDFVATDSGVEKVLLPLRDGLTVIRKK
jgi:predicted O-methyltransferase YrrM